MISDDLPRASKTVKEFMDSVKIELTQETADRLLKRVDPIPFFMPVLPSYLDDIAQREKKAGNLTDLPNWNRALLPGPLDKVAAELGVRNPF